MNGSLLKVMRGQLIKLNHTVSISYLNESNKKDFFLLLGLKAAFVDFF